MRAKYSNKGQSTLEYTIMIAIVIGALLLMQIYMKRGVQGKVRESADSIGEQFDAQNTTISSTVTRTAKTVQVMSNGTTNTYTGAGGGTQEVRTEHATENVAAFK